CPRTATPACVAVQRRIGASGSHRRLTEARTGGSSGPGRPRGEAPRGLEDQPPPPHGDGRVGSRGREEGQPRPAPPPRPGPPSPWQVCAEAARGLLLAVRQARPMLQACGPRPCGWGGPHESAELAEEPEKQVLRRRVQRGGGTWRCF
ncbi:unnamed protein product, partial [Prorocentrum cordatum]